jgi:predicted nucleic acid-binding Zn ribbon protein
MEPASRLLGKLKFPSDSVSAEELVCAAWEAVVGKRIARHARAEALVRSKLIVGVDDSIWGRQLFAMSRMIVSKLTEKLGAGLVDDLEFRVRPPKRGPQRAERSTPNASDEEAQAIEDPNLRRIYINSRDNSRKRELA